MIPSNIQNRLSRLRSRERFLQFVWGAARVAAVALVFVFLACSIDYLVDSYGDTPWALRLLLFFALLASIAASTLFFFYPLLRRLEDEELALWVEDKTPRLQHRLISAVQLNRDGARIEGMSKELVGVVTLEAQQHADKIGFAGVADHQRLKHSALIVLPALILLAVPLLVWPVLSMVLLSRLFLADVAIDRRVTVENVTQKVWPAGEKAFVQVKVSGSHDDEHGKLVVKNGMVSDSYDLESKDRDPKTGQVTYFVEVRPYTNDFKFNAYIGDGRLPENGEVQFKARPVVTNIRAWTQLPKYCDPRKGHGPYLVEQTRGEVLGLPGSSVRIEVELQKKVKEVVLKLYGSASGDPAKPADKVYRSLPMKLKSESGQDPGDEDAGVYTFERTFDLLERETVFEVEAVDRYGFRNDPVPRRTVHEIKEEPPTVALLREQIPGTSPNSTELDDLELEGLPVPKGHPFLIAYYCSHKYGMGRASLRYRVIPAPKEGDSNEKSPDLRWQELKFAEVLKGPGRFDERIGAFSGSGERDSIPFHAVESEDPARILGRVKGGGRYLFQTANIVDGKSPQEGDRIEYYVEVYPFEVEGVKRPVGRSETRVKNVVSFEGFANWMRDWNEEGRVRAIELGQKKIFPGKN